LKGRGFQPRRKSRKITGGFSRLDLAVIRFWVAQRFSAAIQALQNRAALAAAGKYHRGLRHFLN
jgi:hypothetical protein